MIRCIIVDDQPLSQQLLTAHISRHTETQLIGTCNNAVEAFDSIQTKQPDLIFLDIKMPSITGIQLIRSLKIPPAFIFVTAFPEHAAISYDLNAVDYFLKPVTYERFCTGIAKFLRLHTAHTPPRDYTYFKVDGRMVKIAHDKMLYVQSVRDYLVIVTTEGKYITHMTMKYLSNFLPAENFKRVHRSYLVGKRHIISVSRNEVKLGKISIPVGESYKNEVEKIGRE